MIWDKLGIVWKPGGEEEWARSHAAVPTPIILNEDIIRVFVTSLDEKGRGRPIFVDVSAKDPTKVIAVAKEPVLQLGIPGTFDDNGVMAISVIEPKPGTLFMYYSGFELSNTIRYRIFTGLAVSYDNGLTFQKHSRVPVLDRTESELYFRGGSFALHDDNKFKMWYVAGSEWIDIDGKPMPIYDLRYQESGNGFDWESTGQLSMPITGSDEHGFGRPYIVKRSENDFQLFYSIRRKSLGQYRLGYAESKDGVNWIRKDDEIGLDVSPGEFDSDAIMYSAVITVNNRTFCFYNGNNFGEDGFAVAILKKS